MSNATGRGKARVAWLLLAAAVLVLPGAAQAQPFDREAQEKVRASTPAAEAQYLVQTGSRLILPKSRTDILVDVDEKVFVQFERPLRAGERAELTAAGVVFHETFSPGTYLASVPASAADALERYPLFRGLEPIAPSDKVTASLFLDRVPKHARRTGDEVAVFFRFYENVTLDEALAVLDRAGVEVPDRSELLFGARLQARATREQLLAASESPLVRAVSEAPPPAQGFNSQSAGVANVPPVNAAPWNLRGNGVRIGIWDEGKVRNTHLDLDGGVGRVILKETLMFCTDATGSLRTWSGDPCTTNADCSAVGGVSVCNPFNDHATHVAGTMISTGTSDAAAKGMAPGDVRLFSYNLLGDPPTEIRTSVRVDKINLSNHSWGSVLGWCRGVWCGSSDDFGAYKEALPLDWLVRETGHILLRSAGNDGHDCSAADPTQCDGIAGSDGFHYDTIPDRGVAKNIITVGSIDDDGVTKSIFSSAGPTDDGRVKPDVVADGGYDGVWSTCSESDSDYCLKAGTSMSSPVVSGVTALLVERWGSLHYSSNAYPNNPPPELVKALLVNTATDLGRPGPDYAFGHGNVNAQAAVVQLEAPNAPGGYSLAPNQYRIGFIEDGETLRFHMSPPTGAPTGPMRFTLAWTDIEGASGSTSRYCGYPSLKQTCTGDAVCQAIASFLACQPLACGTNPGTGQPLPCHLKNDLNTYMLLPPLNQSIVAAPWVAPGMSDPTGPATNNALIVNHVDNVEVVDTPSFPDGGDFVIEVFGFAVDGQQRFALVADHPLTFFPSNDDFANRRSLPALLPPASWATTCASGESPCPATLYRYNTWNAVNFDATKEPDEPPLALQPSNHQHSVWFTWVADADGTAVFDTAGADFDTLLGAYTGNSVGNLVQLDADDDSFSSSQSRVSFDVSAGTAYHIVVAGYKSAVNDTSMGVFPLNYHHVPVCGNGIREPGEDCDDDSGCCTAACTFEPSGSVCDADGSVCTADDTCNGAGTCNPGTFLFCDDGNECTDDYCDLVSGCVFPPQPDYWGCELDGNICTSESCDGAGTCTSDGFTLYCNDDSACTSDSCDPVFGCAFTDNTGSALDLQLETIVTDQDFTGTTSITAGNGFVVEAPASVRFDAPTIILRPGFAVRQGAGFTAGTSLGLCPVVCAHDICVVGSALDPACDACVATICGVDPFCCNTDWDLTCVGEVNIVCGLSCL